MPKKNTPPFVQKIRGRFRGWAMLCGKRKFGPLRDDAMQAHRDAVKMRGVGAAPSWGGTLGSRADEWIAAQSARWSPDTVEFYRSKLATIFRTIPRSFPIERMSAPVLREFVREASAAGLSARTIQHCRRTLSGLLGWLLRRGVVLSNPVGLVEWPSPRETAPDVMTELELRGLLARISDPWAADLALFVAFTGLRRAEVSRLQVADVNIADRVLWVRGKSRHQSQPIAEDAAAAAARLVAAAGAGEFLVPGSTERGRRNQVAETFRKWQKTLGEPRWHPHALRHSVATIMIRNGVSPATVQRFLRHSSFAMTQRYVSLVENDVRAATATFRLVRDPEKAQHG